MTPSTRRQLEERLVQLDDAIVTLRRGFARQGRRPPDICSLMQQQRNEIARLLSVDHALSKDSRCVEWTTDLSERTPPLGTPRPNASLWDRARRICRSLFSNPRDLGPAD